MDNQHRLITGYRDLTAEEIAAMNIVKEAAAAVGKTMNSLRGDPAVDQRWLAIGITNLQQGFMAVTRAIAKPDSF